MHHTEGHYTAIWHHQCACQYQCQRTLYVGSCTYGTGTRSPVASSSGTNHDLWGVASWVLKGTYLPAQLECTCTMEIPTKAMVGQVVTANQVPPVVHPTRTTKETHNKSPKGWVLEALDLQGLKEWPESEQKQARELLLKWKHLFAHSNLDLGKTTLIKHKIQLTDKMPFKEHYLHIPPHMYNDVRPISRKCWILVLSVSHTVHGLAQ